MLNPNDKRALNPRAVWAVIAGVAVLVVALSYLLIRGSVRPSADDAGQSGQPSIVLSPRNGATLHSERTRFRWTRIASASAYTFYLYEVNRTLVWSTLVRDTALIVPSSVHLQRGNSYLWRVEALLPDETTLRSDLHTFTLSQ